MKTWTTKDGRDIEIKDLEDSHLLNILKLIERMAEELDGSIIDGGGVDANDIWYIEGNEEEWRQKFGYNIIKKEAIKRKLI